MFQLADNALQAIVLSLATRDVFALALTCRAGRAVASRFGGPVGKAVDAVLALGEAPSSLQKRRAKALMKQLVDISVGTAIRAVRIVLDESNVSSGARCVLNAMRGGSLFYALINAIVARQHSNVSSVLQLQRRLGDFRPSKMRPRLRTALSNCVTLCDDASIASLLAGSVEVSSEDVLAAIRSGRSNTLAVLCPRQAQAGVSKKRKLPLSFVLGVEARRYVVQTPR